ncbi:MAG TPA: ABC transporter ATP-binding protein [Anaerolinea thermolimosa]|uniref:ABC transporter ATP-binding protein n=1 Tax=Anaerolinea thermolimosa TaxID=229919 RepID=A0A3D1JIZ1_9CHLR|nr:ABC transporter ATP-binding protein [Anaerolinea thermolimosa]GAP05234.1 ABC-type cobalt transport system, ATPase component [Anaerolinea thermolimosa]HCE18404.1 ABC transporter ATP-binding protein [Anaerolinea thermolimosa]
MNIEVEDLHFSYPGGVEALRGITLRIEGGELVAMVGQNGSGKTTLVKHFNGLLQPSRGCVRVGDWDTRTVSVARLASRVGYVFQNPDDQLFCKTVAEEVAFGPRNLGYAPEKVEQLVRRALAWTGLTGREGTNPYDLSPTWRKMVALAAVLSMDTPVVIFDEPTTGQDWQSVARMARVIAMLREEGKTVITITHDMDFCAENFTRVIALGGGQVLLDGPADEVLGEAEILAQTFVEPPQLVRLARRLGWKETPLTIPVFLDACRRSVRKEDGADGAERRFDT